MSSTQTDWRALCEELISLVERCPVTGDTDWIAERNELIVQVHGARRAAIAADRARWGNCPAKPDSSTPAPAGAVASDVYFEFVVSDADCCTQAGGIAPTYAQALSEGQHYLTQYQQDGPHTLEVRRVEVLHPDALPLPSGEAEQ